MKIMFEIKTALSYLIPRRKQLSVSVVGLIAIGVIQAIVWLILVFFSTTEGIEHGWSEKITGVLGPMQVVPSASYFESPLCQIDAYSNQSNDQPLRISEKSLQQHLPYDPSYDQPLPESVQQWYVKNPNNELPIFLEDLKKLNIPYRFFESTVCHLSIPTLGASPNGSINFYSCLFGLDQLDQNSFSAVSEIGCGEVEKMLNLLSLDQEPSESLINLSSSIKTFDVICTQDTTVGNNQITKGNLYTVSFASPSTPHRLVLEASPGSLIPYALSPKKRPFSVVKVLLQSPPLATGKETQLTYLQQLGYPVILPKQLRQQGVRLLDTGFFEFFSETSPHAKPLQIPFFVAGFFDSGILPIGGKLCITSRKAVLAIDPYLPSHGPITPSGIIIDAPITETSGVIAHVEQSLEQKLPGLFTLQTYDQYEATKDLYQQLASEKTLFRLISCIIICVACSNIFSMLFILAHDRRKEIAILRALGTSKKRIIGIFFIAGLSIGFIGTLMGSLMAALTLHYLPELLQYISQLQGQAILNQTIYGTIGPQTIKIGPLLFTIVSISLVSGISGLLAAIRACTMNISEALRS